MANTPDGDGGSSKHRSPNFPAMALADAVQKVRTIYGQDRRTPTSAAVMLSHLGYGKNVSGSAGRVLAALKQYGLLDEVGDNLRVSDAAFRIFSLSDGSPERVTAIKECARKPRIFREVLEEYPDGLPSDATLSDWLIDKKGFNPTSIAAFIRSFRATIVYAKLEPGYGDGEPGVDGGDSVSADSATATIPLIPAAFGVQVPKPSQAVAQADTGVAREVSALQEGEAILQWPSKLSPESVEELEDWLTLVIKKLKRRYRPQSAQAEDQP
jgi:hypothetical protein